MSRSGHRVPELWQVATTAVVAVGVGFSVLLMSVAFGVARDINHRLSAADLRRFAPVTIHQVDQILAGSFSRRRGYRDRLPRVPHT